MFKLKNNNIKNFYGHCYSEYLIEKYPTNFFTFGIDIGACGVLAKWHINHMGKDNPKTTFIGFEPETNGFNLIKKECASLSNVKLYKEFFGRTTTLQTIIKKHNLNTDKPWYISCDCEGDEKYLFNNKEELDILKTASHIAFEIHPKLASISYDQFIYYFKEYFGNTHKIIRTYHGGGGGGVLDNSSFILVKNDLYENIIKDKINNFKYNWDQTQECLIDINSNRRLKRHFITYIN
jgi:hypothetical protein